MKRDSSLAWRAAAVLTGVVVLAALGRMDGGSYRASVETVCVSLTVIGLDGGDPGSGGCEVTSVVSESSSSVSSSAPSSSASSASSTSASSVSSASSFSSSAQSAGGGGSGNPGGRRGTIEQSESRMIRLLREWRLRRMRPAAPEEPSREWYEEAVRYLRARGAIDAGDLRLDENATRAETAKLVVTMSGVTMPPGYVVTEHFADVPQKAWFFNPIERAAENGWMFGYNNCYGPVVSEEELLEDCYFRPTATITRAEAAAVILRLLRLKPVYAAPSFRDVPVYAWYRDTVQTAADICILQGSGGMVRPDAPVTRAELMVMVHRAMLGLRYGYDCGTNPLAGIPSAFIRTMVSVDYPMLVASAGESACEGTAFRCVMSAVADDIRTYVLHPFIGALVLPGMEDLHAAADSEPLGWALSLALLGIVFFCVISFIIHRRFSHKAAKAKGN